jgi:uncharacterized protein (TIGR03083 family)
VKVRQYYEDPGVPMVVPVSPNQVASAWLQHRARLRSWLRTLPAPAWDGPTRCHEWDVSALVQHLISGAQFLGFTLHQSKKGVATRLLADFDPQATPAAAAAELAGIRGPALLDLLDAVDDRVRSELDANDEAAWLAAAESPGGRVPAFLSVNHFLFDSWVHERDLMLPAGDVPRLEVGEVEAVLSYVLALAGCARADADESVPPPASFEVRVTDVGVCCSVVRSDGQAVATIAAGDQVGPVLTGTANDVVDLATGRDVGDRVVGDPSAVAYLLNLAYVMS